MGDSDSRKWTGERRSHKERRTGVERRTRKIGPAVEPRPQENRRHGERRTGGDRRNEAEWAPVPLELASSPDFDSEQALLAAAIDARRHAQSRYSGFAVGAALETADGDIVTGCNIENATYGLTICAERVALVKALSEGRLVFRRLAVVADTVAPTPPCGPCRQLLWEYCGDIDIILGNLNGPTGRYRLSTLLPLPFDARLLR